MYNVLYHGRVIYRDLSHEQCSEILSELSEKFYTSDEIDPSEIEIEEI